MISKELLSEVLNTKIDKVVKANKDYELSYKISQAWFGTINIYELAHKCKEWAFGEGYILKSYKQNESRWYCDVYSFMGKPLITTTSNDGLTHDIKACEWILEQTK